MFEDMFGLRILLKPWHLVLFKSYCGVDYVFILAGKF